MAAKKEKGATYGCPLFFSPPENIWLALRATKEKAAQMGDQFSESLFLVDFYNEIQTYFSAKC